MKMGEVDGKKIGCTVSLLVSDPLPALPPAAERCGFVFLFYRNGAFCVVSVHSEFLPGRFLDEFTSMSKRSPASFRLN